MKTEFYNELTEGETERLVYLMEECSEVIHACSKILRHGYDKCNPERDTITNKTTLLMEISDLYYSIDLLLSADHRRRDIEFVLNNYDDRCNSDYHHIYFHHQDWDKKEE